MNIIIRLIKVISILCLVISCNKKGKERIAIYDSDEGKYREFNLKIERDKNSFKNYYYQKDQLKRVYKFNFAKSSYLLIDGDDTCNFRLVNFKEFKVRRNYYKIYNFIATTPPNRDDFRIFWNENYGVLYTFSEGYKIFSKTVYYNTAESKVVDNLIQQIIVDFYFHYNITP
jgi:hypothetical protein